MVRGAPWTLQIVGTGRYPALLKTPSLPSPVGYNGGGGRAEGRGYPLTLCINGLALMSQERKDALGAGVGGRQDAGAGLGEDLGAGEVGGFGGEVGVTD